MSLPVSEIFLAQQGEGINAGYPSIFIRTGGCNLSCPGFGVTDTEGKVTGCDSYFSVFAKEYKPTWELYDSWHILSKDIESKIPNNLYQKPDIVFTGGEPLLHIGDSTFINTIKYFIGQGYNVWFETNGTMDPDFQTFPIFQKCKFMISPKLSNSGEPFEKRFRPEVLQNIIEYSADSALKFVCSAENIDQELAEIYDYLYSIPTWVKVFLMPLGDNKETLEQNAKVVYETALKNGFMYSDRLHIRIHDDERGV